MRRRLSVPTSGRAGFARTSVVAGLERLIEESRPMKRGGRRSRAWARRRRRQPASAADPLQLADQPSIVGIFLFIGSEIMLFGSFFTVYFFDRVVNNTHPLDAVAPGRHPISGRGSSALVNTCILVTSSFTMHWATRR